MSEIIELNEEIKVKDFKPKYNHIELMINEVGEYLTRKQLFEMATEFGVVPFEKIKKKYGELLVLSYANYDSTMTTSIILKGKNYK